MNNKTLLIIATCMTLASCRSTQVPLPGAFGVPGPAPRQENTFGDANQDAENVGLVSLIANPQRYDGKHVRVMGVLRIEFESYKLYLTREHYDHRIMGTSVELRLNYNALQTDEKTLSRLSGKYVIIEGTYFEMMLSSSPDGDTKSPIPHIKNITRIDLWQR